MIRYYSIDIVIPLSEWDRCNLEYDKAKQICDEMIEKKLGPEKKMYEFCKTMLELAEKKEGYFYALDGMALPKLIIFGFRFVKQKNLSEFVHELKQAIIHHQVGNSINYETYNLNFFS